MVPIGLATATPFTSEPPHLTAALRHNHATDDLGHTLPLLTGHYDDAVLPMSKPVDAEKSAAKPVCNAAAATRCCMEEALIPSDGGYVVNQTRWDACFTKHWCPIEKDLPLPSLLLPPSQDQDRYGSASIVPRSSTSAAATDDDDTGLVTPLVASTYPSSPAAPDDDDDERGSEIETGRKRCSLQKILTCIKNCERKPAEVCENKCRTRFCHWCPLECKKAGLLAR